MAMTPADLEAAGLDDYVIGVGNLEPLTVEAAWVSRWMGIEKDAAVDAFEVAGVDQAYTMFLDQSVGPGAPDNDAPGLSSPTPTPAMTRRAPKRCSTSSLRGPPETAQLEVAAN